MYIPNKFNKLKINKQDSGLRKIYIKRWDRIKTESFLDTNNHNILFGVNTHQVDQTGFYIYRFDIEQYVEYYEITNGQDLILYMTWFGTEDFSCLIYNFNIYVNETLYKSYEVRQHPSQVELYIDLPQIKENQNYYFEVIQIGTYIAGMN